ncbi:MAG: betaine/proline/choline family ABC transporter ATP-binding protein [Bacillota bacterium]
MIKIDKLTKHFPGLKGPAVDKLTLEVSEGEVCVLVGPSGCGKTTTMKMINRLYEPDGGEVYINGQKTSEMDEIDLRRGIGYVIQQIGLFPHMNIKENIATVPRELGWSEEKIDKRVDELLKMVGLDPDIYKGRLPAALSGGQRQRVGVARALAADPPLMLMDEPFAAVDPITRARLQNEFLRILNNMDKTIIFVTHDINEAIKMGDKIAVLKDGRLVQHATPQELLDSPADDFVAKLVGRNRSIKRLHLIKVKEIIEDEIDRLSVPGDMERNNIEVKLKESEVGALMVLDKNGCLLGRVDQKCLDEKKGETASELAEEIHDTVTADATLNDTLSVMLESGEAYAPVIDEKKGYFRDIITLQDLLQELSDE